MGISRDKWHKRRVTGGKQALWRKKRKFELGRPPANTKLGQKRIRTVRTRGGNSKFRALRLDSGNFSWGSEAITKKTRIVDVVYNSSSNELVSTKTLVKGCIIQVSYKLAFHLPSLVSLLLYKAFLVHLAVVMLLIQETPLNISN